MQWEFWHWFNGCGIRPLWRKRQYVLLWSSIHLLALVIFISVSLFCMRMKLLSWPQKLWPEVLAFSHFDTCEHNFLAQIFEATFSVLVVWPLETLQVHRKKNWILEKWKNLRCNFCLKDVSVSFCRMWGRWGWKSMYLKFKRSVGSSLLKFHNLYGLMWLRL